MTGREAMADRTSTQIDAAIDNFLEAIELDPEYAWAYSGLHDACLIYVSYGLAFHSKCEQPVKQYLDKALELDESVGEAWIALGYHLASGSWSCDLPDERKIEALNAMRKGLLLSPASAQAYLWYGNFLSNPCTAIDKEQAAANRIEVEKVLLKGITIAPLFVGFHQNLAYRYSRKGDTDAALDVVRRMRKILPDAYQSYLVQAQLEYSMNGRLDRFIKYMLEAYAHDPKAWNYLVRIADAYMALGDTAKAREYLRLAEDRMTETWMPWRPVFSRAVATLIDDGPDLAEAPLLEMVDRDDLWSVMPLWLLFNLALADGETDAANAYLEQLHTVCDSPGNVCWPVRYLGTARIMQEQGDEQAARKLVEDTWARFRQETDPEWRRMGVYGAGIHKARMLSMLGDKDLALAELQAAVDDGWRGYYGIDLSAGTDDRFYWSPNWRIDAKYDVMLDGIRDEPGFREAFETIEADMKDQLASINEMERNGELTLPESLASGSAKTD
jgi:tetratricopeptide (TPR) repeat protein